MKSKTAWLALPFLLGALMLGVKWRAEHPTPTKEDLETRAWLLNASMVTIHHLPGATLKGARYIYKGAPKSYPLRPSEAQIKMLVDAFYLSSEPFKEGPITVGEKGTLIIAFSFDKPRKDGVVSAVTSIRLDSSIGQFDLVHPDDNQSKRRPHPATIKRLINILLSNPQIGSELRARMK